MAGSGDPPEGTPEDVPGGDDHEFRSVVFDESFVRAARIQEYSARERLEGMSEAVHPRRMWTANGAPRQALILVVLIAVTFGIAVYLGIRHPYQQGRTGTAQELRSTLIPLAPSGRVPAADPAALYANHRAAEYASGADAVVLPPVHRVGSFTVNEVLAALSTSKDYMVASSVDAGAVVGGDVRTVRGLLDPGQLEQFDRSLARPANDGRHAATGWLVRFDPSLVRLADLRVRGAGTLAVEQNGDGTLEVRADHTFVYALRSTDPAHSTPSLFTVRREMRFHFDREDLRTHRLEVVRADTEAGPLDCSVDASDYFRPLPAGGRPQPVAGTDPGDHGHPAGSVCGALAADTGVTPTTARSPAAPPSPSGRPVR